MLLIFVSARKETINVHHKQSYKKKKNKFFPIEIELYLFETFREKC